MKLRNPVFGVGRDAVPRVPNVSLERTFPSEGRDGNTAASRFFHRLVAVRPTRKGNSRDARSASLPTGAFTLIEILLATAIFATVVVAINTVFFGALHLRTTTTRIVEEAIPRNHALSVIKKDLRATLSSGGALAGPLTGGIQSSMMSDPMLNQEGIDASSGLQIFTATGVTDDSSASYVSYVRPWSEIQKVSYYLRAPHYSTNRWGKELVRAVTRNLLASLPEQPDEQPLLDGVENLQFYFYDGTSWLPTWDSATQGTAFQQSDTSTNQTQPPPQAVKVLIEFAAVNGDERLRRLPLQLVVPIVTQSRTNQAASSGTANAGQTSSTAGGAQAQPNRNTGGTGNTGNTGNSRTTGNTGGNNSTTGGSRGSPQPSTPAPSGGGGARGGGGRGG